MSTFAMREPMMAYQTGLSGDLFHLTLVAEPPYCHALPHAPLQMEPQLRSGVWLVMNYAVWSMPDIKAIGTSLAAAKQLNGQVSLGIRPFDHHDEIRGWCPQVTECYASPVWLILQDGRLMLELACMRDEGQLVAAVSPYLSR